MLASLDPEDTIAAVASPAGNGLRGLIRLSGPEAWSIALAGFTPDPDTPLPRRAEIRSGSLRVDGLRPELPATLALWTGPRTYTGQNIAEIHTHGSPPLVNLVLAGCLSQGARHAEPGEFTLRAFLCGRIDLTRAEAVAGVIDARNQAQLDAALQQLGGGLSGPILTLRDRLLDLVAHLEANLDFAEEPDVNPLGRALLAEELAGSADELTELAARLNQRDRSGGHPRVVLMGPPNAGKSRLFNALLGDDQAIVSPRPGTTRDYLSGFCHCDELIIELIDTAGIENPQTEIESRRSRCVPARPARRILWSSVFQKTPWECQPRTFDCQSRDPGLDQVRHRAAATARPAPGDPHQCGHRRGTRGIESLDRTRFARSRVRRRPCRQHRHALPGQFPRTAMHFTRPPKRF